MTTVHSNDGHPIVMEPCSNTRRVIQAPERRSIERTSDSATLPTESMQRHWELLAIWSFVVFSFAAFFLCGFILWVKCHGGWSH